jgi:hypothetical protein
VTVQHGPRQPPYDGPYDVPVLVDDRPKRLGDFQMTRCTFFSVVATDAVDDWVARLRAEKVPFLLMGLFAVIHRPDLESARFTSPEQISALFDRIDDMEGLVVENAHIWLPNFLLEAAAGYGGAEGEEAPGGKASGEPAEARGKASGEPAGAGDKASGGPAEAAGDKAGPGGRRDVVDRGDLFRVSFPLFQRSLQFLGEVISAERFAEQVRELMEGGEPLLAPSPEEAATLHAWSAEQIDDARNNYFKQRDNPAQVVLPYRDEEGNIHEG